MGQGPEFNPQPIDVPAVPISHVPCRGCTACCHGDAIILHPESGDDISSYVTAEVAHPFTGAPALMVAKKPGTMDCWYLGPSGCTIHDRAPVICKKFDCGKMFARFSRAERRRLVKGGNFSQEVFDQGRRVQAERAADLLESLDSLDPLAGLG